MARGPTARIPLEPHRISVLEPGNRTFSSVSIFTPDENKQAQVWQLLTPEQQVAAGEAEAELARRRGQRRQRMRERRELRQQRRQQPG